MKNKEKLIKWCKEHKIEIIVTTASIISIASVIFVAKRENKLAKFSNISKKNGIINSHDNFPKTICATSIPKNILDNFSGNKFTARELGYKMGVSAQEINKRIIEKGLTTRDINSEY